jgi:cellulose synthase/poly-beta-1,6-N-acetylglucosamine synthase-like glycosyltransferase
MSPIRFSIIVPAHRDGLALRACLDACLEQQYENFEVIVASDQPLPGVPSAVTVVETGSRSDTSPAVKRDAAFGVSSGDILAYVDDDAYPRPDWLERAAGHFADPDVQALGGPGLTPPESSWRERVGGAVYESPAGSGQLRYRFLPLAPRSVTDYPAYNLFVRRPALEAVGGWGTTFYGGEDTVLCLKLAEAGWPVHYAPDVVVYHRRREILRPHLRQVANVGRHRGYFVRAFPRTSRRLLYALPALAPFALGAAAIAARRSPTAALRSAVALYAAVAAESMRRHPLTVAAVTPAVTAAHHLAYGAAFLRGLFGGKLTR